MKTDQATNQKKSVTKKKADLVTSLCLSFK